MGKHHIICHHPNQSIFFLVLSPIKSVTFSTSQIWLLSFVLQRHQQNQSWDRRQVGPGHPVLFDSHRRARHRVPEKLAAESGHHGGLHWDDHSNIYDLCYRESSSVLKTCNCDWVFFLLQATMPFVWSAHGHFMHGLSCSILTIPPQESHSHQTCNHHKKKCFPGLSCFFGQLSPQTVALPKLPIGIILLISDEVVWMWLLCGRVIFYNIPGQWSQWVAFNLTVKARPFIHDLVVFTIFPPNNNIGMICVCVWHFLSAEYPITV